MSQRRRALLPLVAGIVLVLVSAAVFVLFPSSLAAGGRFAYAPLRVTTAAPGFPFLDPTHWWAVLLGAVGLIAASGAAGFLVGRRTT